MAWNYINAIGNLLGTFGGGIANVIMQRRQNEENRRLVMLQNRAAAAESDKAYERSKATNQVSLMQAAGLSKAGALNVLNGGGSYQPAPVSTSQGQAPQMADLSHAFDGMITIGENAKQRKMQEDLQEKQIKAAEDAQKAQIASDEKKHAAQLQTQKDIAQLQADTTNRNADNRLEYDKNYFNQVLVPESIERINQIKEDTKFTKSQRRHFEMLRPILKENAQEEVNKLKEEINSITNLRNLESRRFALDKLKVYLENYFGVSIYELRNTLDYWEERPETLYKGLGWRSKSYKDLNERENELLNYVDSLSDILDAIDRIEVK